MDETSGELRLLFVVLPLGCLLVTSAVLAIFPSVWTVAVGRSDHARNRTLDGVRGLLTLWVFSHHFDVGPEMVQRDGFWHLPDSILQRLMNSGLFVAPFFALTALLFGGRLLASKGELKTGWFVRQRLFRLLPGYVVSVMVIFATAFVMTRFHLMVTPWKLIKQMTRWALLDFVPRYDFNSIDISKAHGMLWTLRTELLFYALLPILAFAQRRLRPPAVLFIGLGLVAVWYWPFWFFLAGLVAASGLAWRGDIARQVWQFGSVLSLAVLIATAYQTSVPLQAVLIVPILLALVLETPLFRPLRWRPLLFVGEISYSIYILHYPLVWIIFTVALDPRWTEQLPFVERMLLGITCGTVVIGLATLCYVCIERPFVRLGRGAWTIPVPPFLQGRGVREPMGADVTPN